MMKGERPDAGGRVIGLRASSIVVTDLDKAIDFYTGVLGMEVRVDERRYNWVELGPKGSLGRLALTQKKDGKREPGGPTGIMLLVDDIHSLFKRAKEKGAKFTLLPQRRLWRGIIAKIEDPDGNEITLLDSEMISQWMMGA
jgi:lactoylglutathione lyase